MILICYNYKAPEAIRNRKYGTKSDVWSFGVVMTEILNREQPFNEINDVLEVALELKNNKTPKIPANCAPVYKNIIDMCFRQDPNERPVSLLNVVVRAKRKIFNNSIAGNGTNLYYAGETQTLILIR